MNIYRLAMTAAVVLSVTSLGAATGGRALRPRVNKSVRSGRIVAAIPLETRMSVGLNQQSFIFELDKPAPGEDSPLIKISYRFALRDPEIPSSFATYSPIQTFKMQRDESCDEMWTTLSTSYRFDPEGNFRGTFNPMRYSLGAPATKVGENVLLPCYVVTPQDYRSTKVHSNSYSAHVGVDEAR